MVGFGHHGMRDALRRAIDMTRKTPTEQRTPPKKRDGAERPAEKPARRLAVVPGGTGETKAAAIRVVRDGEAERAAKAHASARPEAPVSDDQAVAQLIEAITARLDATNAALEVFLEESA